jgi:hypothetical protein
MCLSHRNLNVYKIMGRIVSPQNFYIEGIQPLLPPNVAMFADRTLKR